MSPPTMSPAPAACKARAVQLAVESAQPLAQPARDLGVHATTWQTGSGTEHRTARQATEVHAEPLYDEVKRLRQANARGKEERAI